MYRPMNDGPSGCREFNDCGAHYGVCNADDACVDGDFGDMIWPVILNVGHFFHRFNTFSWR